MRAMTFEAGILHVDGDKAREITKCENFLFFRVIRKGFGELTHYITFKNRFIDNPIPHPLFGRCKLSHQEA